MTQSVDQALAFIRKSVEDALKAPPATAEQKGRAIVSSFDAMMREYGGSAEFVGVCGGEVLYTVRLPAAPRLVVNMVDLVREITPDFKLEDVAPHHGRIRVPAEHIEAVRAAVEPHRIAGNHIEYIPLESQQ